MSSERKRWVVMCLLEVRMSNTDGRMLYLPEYSALHQDTYKRSWEWLSRASRLPAKFTKKEAVAMAKLMNASINRS